MKLNIYKNFKYKENKYSIFNSDYDSKDDIYKFYLAKNNYVPSLYKIGNIYFYKAYKFLINYDSKLFIEIMKSLIMLILF